MIRTVRVADLETACLGFGCASLGSRIAAPAGLKSLHQAFERGVTWFDVAPAYGGGEAEAILGSFLRGRRDRVRICTKVGLKAPQHSALVRRLLPVARGAIGALKGLRSLVRRSGASRNVAQPLDGQSIRAAADAGLQRLATGHIDLFALHMPRSEDLERDDVLRALEDLVVSGKALRTGVAGDAMAAMAARRIGGPYHVIQLADGPHSDVLEALRAQPGPAPQTITHSIFGVGGTLARGVARLRADPALLRTLNLAGYEGPAERIVADLLLDRALAANKGGVVLTSMFQPDHLAANLARASRPADPAALGLSRQLLG